MRDKSEVLTGAQKNRFGLILYIILLSVVYILITRLNLTTTYYSLYSSLGENSQVTEYFIISIATFLFLSGLCLLFIYSFFKRKRVVGKLLLAIHLLYISHYAITFVYCLYVVGAECMTGFAPIFPDICYHLTHYKPAAADIPVASDNPAHYADAIRYNARTPLQGSLLPLTRLVWA